jgi:hypothetical protein
MSGNNTISEDITVASGVTLTITAGSTLNFQNGAKLIVNGTLTSNGTSNNRITFTGATRGCWGGIYFNSSSTWSVIMYCNIKNASTGIVINNASPCIGDCFIDDPYFYGIYIQGSSANPSISHNYIEGSTYYTNSACVVHYNGGNGWLTNNSLRNSKYGVIVYSGSPCYDYDNIGRNKFESSISWHKFYVSSGQPWVTSYQYFTVPNPSYKYIYSMSASTIHAETDYWSAYPPSDSYFFGTVNRSYPLQNPPNPAAGPNWSLPKSNGGDFFTEFKAALYFSTIRNTKKQENNSRC